MYLYIIRASWNFDEQTLPNVNVWIKRFHYLKVCNKVIVLYKNLYYLESKFVHVVI